jgi:hypothetical protein
MPPLCPDIMNINPAIPSGYLMTFLGQCRGRAISPDPVMFIPGFTAHIQRGVVHYSVGEELDETIR